MLGKKKKSLFHRGHHNKIAAAIGRAGGKFARDYKDSLSSQELMTAKVAQGYMVAEITGMLLEDNILMDDDMFKEIMSKHMLTSKEGNTDVR